MAAAARAQLGRPLLLSVEVEKPYLPLAELLPLLRAADVVVVSREWVERQELHALRQELPETSSRRLSGAAGGGDSVAADAPTNGANGRTVSVVAEGDDELEAHAAIVALRAIRKQVTASLMRLPEAAPDEPLHGALWVCPWGTHGAYALAAADAALHAPAVGAGVDAGGAVDTVGAGDTFIAALLYALAQGATPEQALGCGCAVAGRKVTQRGFVDLASAVPPDVQQLAAAPGPSSDRRGSGPRIGSVFTGAI